MLGNGYNRRANKLFFRGILDKRIEIVNRISKFFCCKLCMYSILC